ncbi:hypothetical protein G7Z17_g12579 [Cylindrodendrum hubeiense]|uniref:Uncharacterized protein n=1 Tax=Cylindrodendrum hubeiense TaxID=595255 RepID=A0A9P5L2Z0_9HYPO|nr:hypothetical protein G7Z17_g12579 [Cylindrodendrum hubeiense]
MEKAREGHTSRILGRLPFAQHAHAISPTSNIQVQMSVGTSYLRTTQPDPSQRSERSKRSKRREYDGWRTNVVIEASTASGAPPSGHCHSGGQLGIQCLQSTGSVTGNIPRTTAPTFH